MERIGSGFALAEAPVVTSDEVLLVSDVLGGGVRRFDRDGGELTPLLDRRRGIGGMAIDSGGSVVVSGRDLSTVGDDGELLTIAEMLHGGTGYNDLARTPEGSILAGMLTCHPMSGGDLTPGVLMLVDGDGDVSSTPLPFPWPNGIGFSPNGDELLIADFDAGVVHHSAWDGRLESVELRPWAASPTGDTDGLAVADDGFVWIAGGAGGVVLVCDPGGAIVQQVAVPDDFVSSCCFWPATNQLVVTTGTGVFLHDLD